MGVMPKPSAPVYRTTNWPEYNAALKRRGSLEIWFDPEMHWLSVPCGRPGRPMRFSDSAIELCLTAEDAVQPAFAASDGIGGEPDQNGGAGLAGAGLYDAMPTAEDADGQAGRTAQPKWSASAGRQHRDQDDGRRRVEDAQTWRILPSPVAQSASWD